MIHIITKQQVVGKVEKIAKDGTVNETEEFVLGEVIVDDSKQMANVGGKLGKTQPVPEQGQYNMLRVDVSMYMPSDTDKKSLNKTFKKCLKWCDEKMDEILN